MITIKDLWDAMPRDVQRKMSLHDLRRTVETYNANEKEAGPPPSLLESMAVRSDHGLGVPGYYDGPMFQLSPLTHADRMHSAMGRMRQLWEEVTGNGFYRNADELWMPPLPTPLLPSTMEEPP